LLREERYTIEGAKQVLKTYTPETEASLFDQGEKADAGHAADPAQTSLFFEPEGKLREDLKEIQQFLLDLRERIRG
jgi:hypothetical protein